MGGKAALVLILGFSFVLGYISTNLSNIATRAQGNMSSYTASTVSHNLAISAANAGLAQLYQDTSWRGTVSQTLSGSLNGTATYSIANDATGRPFLRAVSVAQGTDGLVRDTVEISFAANSYQSFTLFAWLTDFEGNVFWFTGDSVWGRVHSNGNLHMSGTPVFMQKVTTSKGFDPKWGTGGNDAIFKAGYETGIGDIQFPTDLSPLFAGAASGGRAYTGNIEVRLNGGTATDNDGYALVYSGSTLIDSINLNASGFNGAITSTGVVSVNGTLDGKLTIGSSTNIYVTDDIVYENRNYDASDDVLGLVANGNVTVADNTANSSNCEIDGSVFARSGSYGAENYNHGSPRGVMKLTGSIVQKTRGAVGTFQNGTSTLKTGYSKRYRYDDRLSDPTFRPPFYPGFYTGTFAISNWWENVRIPKFY
jgi:hypothetical protein